MWFVVIGVTLRLSNQPKCPGFLFGIAINRTVSLERCTLELSMLVALSREIFKQVHDGHWRIEGFYRVIKQVCNIERFHVRNGEAIRNHIFCALRAFSKLQTMRIDMIDR